MESYCGGRLCSSQYFKATLGDNGEGFKINGEYVVGKHVYQTFQLLNQNIRAEKRCDPDC